MFELQRIVAETNEAAGKGDAGQGSGQIPKRAHPFILGNPLPALGDYGAAKKFTGQMRGVPEAGAEQAEQR